MREGVKKWVEALVCSDPGALSVCSETGFHQKYKGRGDL